jgi:hypothetical protein
MCYVYKLDGEILDVIDTNREVVWWICPYGVWWMCSKVTHEEDNK